MPTMKATERRLKVRELIERFGLWGIPKTAVCKEWGIARTTLDSDIEFIMKNLKDTDISVIAKELQSGYEAVIGEMRKIVKDPNSSKSEKARAAVPLLNANQHYTEHLEKWGKKAALAQKLEVGVNAESELTVMLERAKERLKEKEKNG